MIHPVWRVVGAAVPGTAHRARNLGCQDAFAYRVLPQGALVIAVADGAGSAERAADGARGAVEQARAFLETTLTDHAPADDAAWRALMRDAFRAARDALTQLGATAQLPVRAFATTLTCAILVADRLIVAQLGDGAVIAQTARGAYVLAATPQRGEYANEAYLLSMPGALDQIVVTLSDQPLDALAVMTDGLLRLALQLPGYAPFPKFFEPLFAFAAEAQNANASAELAAFLDSERVCARTDDDKTLVLVARQAVPA
ncbi:MAG: protein phosphatase 2C domain-containing protein [Chloroflexi bacterium]|nr:protein phosphatase 2C domain-containing protein [Chloroflexota bacterium]